MHLADSTSNADNADGTAATKTKRWKESGSDDNADDNAGDNNADEADDYDDADGKCDGDHDEDAVSKGYALEGFSSFVCYDRKTLKIISLSMRPPSSTPPLYKLCANFWHKQRHVPATESTVRCSSHAAGKRPCPAPTAPL